MSGLEYLNMYASKDTIHAYKLAIKKYLESIYQKDITNGDLDHFATQYLDELRNHQHDVEGFLSTIKDRPPKTRILWLAATRTFLLENKVELPQLFWRHLRMKVRGSRALTLDKVPSNLELRTILQHLPIQGKALFLFLSSTGMRIGEALQVKIEDLDLEQNKVSIQGVYTKTGNSRVAFFSSETREALVEWLKNRGRYLEQATGRSGRYEKTQKDKDGNEDMRLFPFLESTLYKMWGNALEKAGLLEKDASTKRNVSHPHVLRKFFRTRLGSVIPVDVVEALMGYEGYLTDVYCKYSVEDLAAFYKKGEGSLLVFSNGVEVSKLKVEIEEKNKQLQDLVTGLALENQAIKTNYIELQRRLQKLEDSRGESDKIMDRLFEDPEFKALLKRKLKDLKL